MPEETSDSVAECQDLCCELIWVGDSGFDEALKHTKDTGHKVIIRETV